MCQFFEFETHFQAVQNTVVSISKDYISIKPRIKIISSKKYKQKKTRLLRRKNG